ncbi:methionine adenosyltransferase, partial [Candidatus Marsarchaeota archaeon]|nr:methionine adenosyltransferase [Candidatus Marsarchaeota archaeon]
MKNITIIKSNKTPLYKQEIEYVERKGRGHPDSLIDGIVENASIELSKQYLDNFGAVLHHNVDKGLIVGGESNVGFGKGVITKPIEVIIAGRATSRFMDKKIPVGDIVIDATKKYLKENTRFLDIEKEVVVGTKLAQGSADLNNIFMRNTGTPLANDTSFGIGFAPFTETENLSLKIENYLNSKAYKSRMPVVGEDIKIMGVREKNEINVTVAIAFVSKFVRDIEEYIGFKERIAKDLYSFAKKLTDKNLNIEINTGDLHEKGDVYLTKSGLSCEAGDDGSVGRGNRINGIITPFRSMSLEAASGKNPVNHVGKIYSIMANKIANDVSDLYPDIDECNVSIVSQIGRSISDPKNLKVELIGKDVDRIKGKVAGICEEMLDGTKELHLPSFP